MALTIRRLVPRDGVRDAGGALETAARDALQCLEDEDLTVSFGIWDDGDGVHFVCRVETAPGDPLGSEPPWSWWSPLFRNPQELRDELARMAARRLGNGEAPHESLADGDAASAVAS